MKILAETHCHTLASTHAYNTATEMIAAAGRLGLELISLTDHGPKLPDAPHHWHFGNLRAIPHKVDGLYVLRGAEANILDYTGAIDLREDILRDLDIVIASIHHPVFAPGTLTDHTAAYLSVVRNPYVDIIGHCGTPEFAFDVDAVLEEAKKYDKIIEINHHTFDVRQASIPNCEHIARRCREIGVKVAASTDAHSIYELGNVQHSLRVFEQVGMPEELVVNTTAEKLLRHLCARRGYDRSRFEQV